MEENKKPQEVPTAPDDQQDGKVETKKEMPAGTPGQATISAGTCEYRCWMGKSSGKGCHRRGANDYEGKKYCGLHLGMELRKAQRTSKKVAAFKEREEPEKPREKPETQQSENMSDDRAADDEEMVEEGQVDQSQHEAPPQAQEEVHHLDAEEAAASKPEKEGRISKKQIKKEWIRMKTKKAMRRAEKKYERKMVKRRKTADLREDGPDQPNFRSRQMYDKILSDATAIASMGVHTRPGPGLLRQNYFE